MRPNNYDYATNLRTVDKKMKQITYKLKRLVADQERHIELKDGMPEEIDVLESTTLLIKVNTKDKPSPARVTIKYGPG